MSVVTGERAAAPKISFRIQLTGGASVLSVSEGVESLLGYTPQDFASSRVSLAACIHPDDADIAEQLFEAEASQGPSNFNLRLRHADGRIRCLCGHSAREDAGEDGQVLVLDLWAANCPEDEAEGPTDETSLGAVLERLEEGVYFKDTTHVYRHANSSFCKLFRDSEGRPLQVVGRTDYELMPEAEADRLYALEKQILAGSESSHATFEWKDEEGSPRWMHLRTVAVKEGAGEVAGFFALVRDVTLQKRSEERLRLAAEVFAHTAQGIVITDAEGTILDVNAAFSEITGYSRDEAVGKNPRILNSGRHPKEFFTEMWRDLTRKGQWFGEIWNRRKDGDIYPGLLTINAVRDAAGAVQQYVGLFSDLSLIKQEGQKLEQEQASQMDLLTGLPNRTVLADRMHQAMAQAQRRNRPVAIVYVDLDNFRAINDKQGRDVGDRFLQAVAQRMRQTLHEDDTLARMGGDEFVALLPDLEHADASHPLLDAMLEAAAEPVTVDDMTFKSTASLGVTFYPQVQDVDADQLMRQADQAMYNAKLKGKNRYHIFDPREDRSVRGYHQDIERIRHALLAEEFVLYYQPKVNMRTGEVLGAEALIRWQHPQAGLLLPVQFLPVINGHPLAIELGEWVIDEVLSQMERWSADGLNIPVSVNIAAQQLQQENFVDRLRSLLENHPAVEPSRLELELLESTALQDVSRVSEVIAACNSLGLTFALDDFGTGYSTLTYLRHLPAGILKVDQSFIRGMLEDPEDLMILEGMLGLASTFRRDVVAEGVETAEHGLILLRLGCEVAQGFHIARPMPARALRAWVPVWKPSEQWASALPVAQKDRPVLYAQVEHRHWEASVESMLNGSRPVQHVDSHEQCRFGAWLKANPPDGYPNLPTLPEIEKLHRQVHDLAAELLAMKSEGRRTEAWKRMDELSAMIEGLQKLLQDLMEAI